MLGGRRKAMKEAQMFPADFDGIIAGAALDCRDARRRRPHRAGAAKGASPVPPAKAQCCTTAVVNACDGLDGLKDGLIENPAACKFDPAYSLLQGR